MAENTENNNENLSAVETVETDEKPKMKLVLVDDSKEATEDEPARAATVSAFFGLGMEYPEREFRRTDQPFEVDAEFGRAAIRMHPEYFAEYQEIHGVPVTKTSLNKSGIEELKVKADELKIEGFATMKKTELIDAILLALTPPPAPPIESVDPNKSDKEPETEEKE